MKDVRKLNVADGQIRNIKYQNDEVTVIVTDWKGQRIDILFKNVIGWEAYSPENVDLSHISVNDKSDNIVRVCDIVDEFPANIFEYSFISAWNEKPILTIYGELENVLWG